MEEAAERIIICGEDRVTENVANFDIGLVLQVKPPIYDVDYGNAEVLDCTSFTYSEPTIEDAVKQTEENLRQARKHLETADNKVLIHCSAGADKSPMFALLLLIHMAENNGDNENYNIYKLVNLVHSIKDEDVYLAFDSHADFLPFGQEECQKLQDNYTFSWRLKEKTLQDSRYKKYIAEFITSGNLPEKWEAFKRFGFISLTNTALCAADNDRQGQLRSSPRKPVSP